MASFSIQLPQDVQNQIVSAAAQHGVDALVAQAVAQVLSGGQQFSANGSLLVTPYGVGVMGISKTTAMSLGFDATQQVSNIQAGVAYLSQLVQAFVGNYALAIAAYITSVPTVQKFGGVPPLAPVQNFVYNVSTLAALGGSIQTSAAYAISNQSTEDPSDATSSTAAKTGAQGTNWLKSAMSQKEADDNLNALQQTLQPQLQIPDDTLGATAWYADTGLVTGNPRIRASVQPVEFMVYLDRNDPTQFLSIPQNGQINSQATTKQPVIIQLNTSMETFEITSKHVYNRTPSRTGMHITLWGMQPDLISGTGTTGVFMNQFGLTDFFSVAQINDDITKLLTSGFAHKATPYSNPLDQVISTQYPTIDTQGFDLVSTVEQGATGQPSVSHVSGDQAAANSIIASRQLSNPQEAFRVAAQDAFIEFMKLFQMNGSVYYFNQNYNGVLQGSEQLAPSAWSPQTGATSFQQHSRNNDVMTRGYVEMRYRNNIYLGYFKSLSWTQDADSPFQWKFNFSFQVEKTYTALYYPTDTVASSALARIVAAGIPNIPSALSAGPPPPPGE